MIIRLLSCIWFSLKDNCVRGGNHRSRPQCLASCIDHETELSCDCRTVLNNCEWTGDFCGKSSEYLSYGSFVLQFLGKCLLHAVVCEAFFLVDSPSFEAIFLPKLPNAYRLFIGIK